MLVSTMVAQLDENVRRGYRLHISNLEDRAFTFTVKYWVTPPDGEPRWAAALNQFFTLYAGLYGVGTANTIQAFARTGSVYVASMTFVVEPKHTVPVGITPSMNASRSDGIHLLEGYVTLEVPVLRQPGKAIFRPQPQSMDPITVLLNPETTMVHTDSSGPGGIRNMDGVVTGHISVTRLNFDAVEPIVPASGQAENAITANGQHRLDQDALVAAVKASEMVDRGSLTSAENFSRSERMETLITLLCELDSNGEFIDELNKVLKQNQASARICGDPRKPRGG